MLDTRFSCRHLIYRLLLIKLASVPLVTGIMVPDMWNEMYQAKEEPSDRYWMIEDILNVRRENEIFLKSLPCVSSFLKTHITDPDRSSFLVPEYFQDVTELTSLYMKNLKVDIATYMLEGKISAQGEHRIANSAIILTKDAESLTNTSTCIQDLCDRDCKFVVILTSMFEDEESFLVEADTLIDIMWTYWVAKVVILAPVRDVVLVAGSLSFRAGEFCSPSSPLLLGRCEENVWTRFKNITDPTLNGCTVKIAYFDVIPYASALNDTGKLTGIEGVMVEEIMSSLNVEVEREQIAWTDNTSVVDELKTWLDDDARVDLVIGGMIWRPNDDVEYTVTYEMSTIVWMVPVTPNVSLRGLVMPFRSFVWVAIGCVLLLGCLVRIFLIRDITCLDITALILGVSTSRQPIRASSRTLFISWAIFGFVLTQFYLGSLADQLTNAADLQIETVSELLSSSLQLGGLDVFLHLFEEDPQEPDETITMIREKFVVFDYVQYTKQLNELMDGTNNSFALIVSLNVSRSNTLSRLRHVHVMKETLGNYPIALATWKGLPFLKQVNRKIQDLIEVGLVGFWSIMVTPVKNYLDDVEDSERAGELRLQQFAPAFLLLVMGFCAGFCCLIIEIAAYPSKLLE